jgi:hypothetical protein
MNNLLVAKSTTLKFGDDVACPPGVAVVLAFEPTLISLATPGMEAVIRYVVSQERSSCV